MQPAYRTGKPGVRIDYKSLRRISPEAARRAVLEYLAACGHNVAQTACVFGITRSVVYHIQAKEQQGDLRDRSQAPKRQPRKTAAAVEDQVVAAKNKTRSCLSADRLGPVPDQI